jgi:histone acetyltransferase (RNA polymerase elongator complex component)
MNLQEIIFKIISNNPLLWVRHWETKESTGLTFKGIYVELRANFISDVTLKDLLEYGFKIDRITTQKINADVYSDVLLKKDF